MVVLRFTLKAFSVITAALAGNWVGAQVRTLLTGQEVQAIRFRYTTAQGTTIHNIPVVTKFYPALGAAGLGRPRWLYAFAGGVMTGALIDERFERYLWDRIGAVLPTREWIEGITSRPTEREDNILVSR